MESDLLALHWMEHTTVFRQAIGNLRAKGAYADATLACDGHFYPVHKFVLSTCSQYFGAIFEWTPCINPVVVINNVTYKELEALIDFMYIGEVSVKESLIPDVMRAAEFLKIRGLSLVDEEKTKTGVKKKKKKIDIGEPPRKKKKTSKKKNASAGLDHVPTPCQIAGANGHISPPRTSLSSPQYSREVNHFNEDPPDLTPQQKSQKRPLEAYDSDDEIHDEASIMTNTQVQEDAPLNLLPDYVSPPPHPKHVSALPKRMPSPSKRVSASPKHVSAPKHMTAPKHMSSAPKHGSSVRKHGSAPKHNKSAAPKRMSAPKDVSAAPKHASVSPKCVSAPPQQVSPPPQSVAPPPQCIPPPSQHMPAPSQHVSSPPPQHGSPPPQHGSPPPQHVSPPPQHVSPPPQHVSLPQQYVSPPPQNVSPPPQHVSPPPQHVPPPPQHVPPPPQHVSPPPQVFLPSQQQILEQTVPSLPYSDPIIMQQAHTSQHEATPPCEYGTILSQEHTPQINMNTTFEAVASGSVKMEESQLHFSQSDKLSSAEIPDLFDSLVDMRHICHTKAEPGAEVTTLHAVEPSNAMFSFTEELPSASTAPPQQQPQQGKKKKKSSDASGSSKKKKSSEVQEPFRCRDCNNKEFKTRNSLNRHMKTHNTEPFNCDMCSFSTMNYRHSLEHKRKEHPVNFICDLCDFTTHRRENFRRHTVMHQKQHQCSECKYRSKTLKSLEKHIKEVHEAQ